MDSQNLSKEHRPIPQKSSNSRISNCSHPWKSSLININGDVHACPHSGLKLGNLHEVDSFEDIWNGPTLQSIREHIKKGKQHPHCKSAECPFQIEHSGIDTGNEWIDIEAKPGTNKELAHSEYISGVTKVTHQPAMLIIAATTKCNLRCVMCPHAMGRVHVYQDLEQICMDRLEEPLKRAERVDITGVGEPFLSKAFWNFIKTQKKRPGQYTRLNSNGHLITKENAPFIVNSVASEISISFDASQASTYKKIRGSHIERVKQGVRNLVEARNKAPNSDLKIFINITLMRENISELADLVRIGKELGVDRVVAYQLFSFGDSPVWVVERGEWEFRYSEQMLKHFPELAGNAIREAIKTSQELDMPLGLECKTKEYIKEGSSCSQ